MNHKPSSTFIARGFTLIELLIVMAIIATLLSIATPRYFTSVDKAKEATLKTNLRIMRENIDKYHADTGYYPPTLQALVSGQYLQSVPIDPITDQATTWILVAHPNPSVPGIYNIHSGAPGLGKNGTPYQSW